MWGGPALRSIERRNCVSIATVVTRTRHNVKLYGYRLSCFTLKLQEAVPVKRHQSVTIHGVIFQKSAVLMRQGKTEVLGEIPVTVPLFPPQM